MKNQRKIWDKLAIPWKNYKVKPINEAQTFLKNKRGKILDLGCGSGRNFQKIEGMIYGVDFSKNMLKHAQEYAQKEEFDVMLKKAKASKLPFPDNFFDYGISIAVIHCLPKEKNRKKALKEIYRTLKPKGKFLLTVWDKQQKRFRNKPKEVEIPWTLDGKKYYRYYYLYDKLEIENIVKEVGFKIIKSQIMSHKKIRDSQRIVIELQKP